MPGIFVLLSFSLVLPMLGDGLDLFQIFHFSFFDLLVSSQREK